MAILIFKGELIVFLKNSIIISVFFSEYISIKKKEGVEYSYIIVFSLWQDMESCCFSSPIGEVSN
jgi:hypothetical protein